jgi:glycosyltransferase involved in cell wall biosynthesis
MTSLVTYWTGIWEPHREALSSQVQKLRAALAPGSIVVSFSPGQRTRMPRDRVLRLSGRRWLLLRGLALALEPRAKMTHVVGGTGSWHLLRSLGRRPILFTVALAGHPLEPSLYDKVAAFAAESEELAAALGAAGVDPAKIRLIRPGIDLALFHPSPAPPPSPFKLLFASTPADPHELDERGIPLLVELAREVPDLELTLLWRRWGSLADARKALRALDPPANLKVIERDSKDMSAELASVHATVCLFSRGAGKSCPNSVIEGLAVGRPALVSEEVGIAPTIDAAGAGRVASRDVPSLVAALETLRSDFAAHSARARLLAEQQFDWRETQQRYRELYRSISARSVRA